MATRPGGEEDLIEIVIRVPRETVEGAILAARGGSEDQTRLRLALTRTILRGRQRRLQFLHGVRFGEPSWDMILDLYAATLEGRQVDVTGLCVASASPRTTALRHIDHLIATGSIQRVADGRDARRTLIVMSASLRASIGLWLDRQIAACAFALDAREK